MANVFALKGAADAGKSSTIIEVMNQLKFKYPQATITTFHGGTSIDVKVIIRTIKGLIVGIESQGDPSSRLEGSLADFRAAKCDIIFCACRTRGMTVMWINKMSPQYNVQFIQQTRTSTGQNAANLAMATQLIQMAGL